MKTALEQAIEQVKAKKLANENYPYQHPFTNLCVITALTETLKILTDLLPVDQQQIFDAHRAGSFSVICENSETPEGYYEKTFENQ